MQCETLYFLIFHPIITDMLNCRTGLPQYKKFRPKTQSHGRNIRKGLDTYIITGIIFTVHSSQFTVHSSQLTAHSSQRELYLDNFLSTFHRHYYLFSLYTQKQTAKCVIYPKDSAIHLGPTQLLIMNYEFIISYKFHSALYCNSRQAIWFDTG